MTAWEKENPYSKVSLNKDNGYFNVLIDGSYTNKRIKEITLADRIAFRTLRFRRVLRDILFDFGNDSMNAVSKLFGNGMGLVSSREGYLKNIPKIKKGHKVIHKEIEYSFAEKCEITAINNPCPIDMDGEYVGTTPLKTEVISNQLKMLYVFMLVLVKKHQQLLK